MPTEAATRTAICKGNRFLKHHSMIFKILLEATPLLQAVREELARG
jgi:hypothetical protein